MNFMVARYNLYNVEPKFKDFLHAENISDDTLKNYLSDIRHFTGWTVENIPPTNADQYNDILTKSLVENYKQYLSRNNVPVVTINRRLSSLRKYFDFLVKESLLQNNEARLVSNIKKESKLNKIKSTLKVIPLKDKESSIPYENSGQSTNKFNLKFNISNIYKYIAFGTLFLFVLFNISSIAINKFSGKSKNLVEVKKAARGRTLNFKGKLLDNLGNPITSKTDVTFKIYTKESSNIATYIGQCKGVNGVIPDTDGFASILVGKDCHMEPIPQTVFSENPSLYLGVTIGSDKELSPRQQIANVAYSLDSEKLQGLSLGEEANSVPYFDENGTMNLKASESSIHSYSADGTFSITSDGSLLLGSGDNSDVTLASGISGSIKFKTGGFSDSMSNLFVGTDGNVGVGTENPSDFKLQIAGDVGPENDDTFNLGSETKQWANVYSSKFLQNGVALCDEQGNNCPTNISSWTLSSPYLYTNQANTRVGIGTSNTASIISKLFVTKDINDSATGKALAIFDQTENQDIFTASASGQTRFVVRRNGDTGIGTISPNARLDVSGGQTKIEVSTQYTERLCHSGSESGSSQNVFLGDCSSGGADIAEYYGSDDKDIEAGDIVIAARGGQMSGLNSKGYINKSNSEYDNRIIGIVSTNPYDSFGKSFDKNESIFPVALAGRIPVKISKTSDVIKAGDFITSSSEPGKAMKAKHAGQIIGKALEDWSPDKNKDSLLVFLNISWSDPGLSLSASGQIDSSNSTSPFVYNGILEKSSSQIEFLNSIFKRATDQEKNALFALWQSKDVSAEKSASILDIAYSIAQNSLSDAAVKIQNLIVSKKIVSPIIETTDLVASGSSRLSEIHTNNIQTDGKDIEINLDTNVNNSDNYKTGPLAELIIKGTDGRKAASIDADGNATFSGRLAANSASISGELTANSINSTQLQSDLIRTNEVSATNLNSANASISGTLTADNISSNTIRALEQRINALADSSKVKSELPASESALIATSSNSATIASKNSIDNNNSDTNKETFNIKEIQKLIDQLKTSSLANPEYYHEPENIQNSSKTTSYPSIASLKEQINDLDLESLTVTGNTNVYKLNAADSIAVGNMIIENNSILALADNLNISAISTITLFDGAITIAHDGTMTTKGAIIARGGIKTNTIEAIDKNVVVKLSQGIKSDENNPQTESNSKFIIANPAGSEVASIDASGSAQFDEISVSKYMDATKSGSLISAEDNLQENGLYSPAYNADKKAAGIGIIPENSSEVVIYTDKIKEGSLVYLTPSEQLSEGQLSILENEPCTNGAESCQPYFRVGISKAEHQQIPFNWLIIN